ncbi:MAG: TonB-dependent receptor [Pseudomonadota bacterium]
MRENPERNEAVSRRSLAATTALVVATTLAAVMAVAPARAQESITFDIPAQSLDSALRTFSDSTGISVVFSPDTVAGLRSQAVAGDLAPREALGRLTQGAAVQTRFLSDATVQIEADLSDGSLAEDQPFVLDEVVVTARRTEEAVADVPGSVTVLSAEEIERSNIEDANDAFLRLPNVSFAEAADPTNINLSIRGVSNLVGIAASGPTNGVFADGILLNPTGGTTQINSLLVDLERTEAAFGPQGTAFGRGTIGGAINFVTKKPTDEFEASFEAQLGSFPDGRATAIVNAPLLEDGLLSARLVAFGGMSDGFLEFPPGGSGPDTLTTEDAGFRLSLRSRPTDRITLDASVSFSRSAFDGQTSASQESVAAGDPVSGGVFLSESSVTRLLSSLQASYDFDVGTLRSTTSFFTTDVDFINDGDFNPGDFIVSQTTSDEQAIAQELRFESEIFDLPSGAGSIAFNAGTSISFNRNDDTFITDLGPDAFDLFSEIFGIPLVDDGSITDAFSDQEVFNFGVFADIRWRPIPDLEVSAGARFSFDRVSSQTAVMTTGLTAVGSPPLPFISEKASFTAFTPNAAIKYDWNDSFSTYLSYSTGFRAGGFAPLLTGFDTFEEENARSFEGGFRAALFDDRLQLSGSGYFLDYDDIQVAVSVPDGVGLISTIDNAAKARSVGAEFGLAAFPIEGLRIDTQLGINFSSFTDFEDAISGDLTGTRLPNASVYSLSVVGDYEHPRDLVPGLRGFLRAEYTFRSSFTSTSVPGSPVFDAYDILNFRLGLRGERLAFEAFVENALNEVYALGSTSFGSSTAFLIEPGVDVGPTRRFGIRAKVHF